MFCINCGTEMSDDARFCHKCGYDRMEEIKLVKRKRIIEDNQVKYTIIPKFNLKYYLLVTLIEISFIFLLFLFPIFGQTIFYYPIEIVLSIIICIIVAYVLIRLVCIKNKYHGIEYNFYLTKIEYKTNDLNKVEKNLKYSSIVGIRIYQNILERLCHIGSIHIYTNVYDRNTRRKRLNRSDIFIHCVEDVQNQYQIIKKIIEESSPEE